jgi:hypothetical protein
VLGDALCVGAPVVGARRVGALEIGQYVVEYAADRQAYRRDRRMGTHVRFPS